MSECLERACANRASVTLASGKRPSSPGGNAFVRYSNRRRRAVIGSAWWAGDFGASSQTRKRPVALVLPRMLLFSIILHGLLFAVWGRRAAMALFWRKEERLFRGSRRQSPDEMQSDLAL